MATIDRRPGCHRETGALRPTHHGPHREAAGEGRRCALAAEALAAEAAEYRVDAAFRRLEEDTAQRVAKIGRKVESANRIVFFQRVPADLPPAVPAAAAAAAPEPFALHKVGGRRPRAGHGPGAVRGTLPIPHGD